MGIVQVTGPFGVRKTRAAMCRRYWWPSWHSDVERYVKKCCNTSSTHIPAGLLQPLQVPDVPWQSLSMGFITQLLEARKGHDAIMVFADRLIKMVHFAPIRTEALAEDVA